MPTVWSISLLGVEVVCGNSSMSKNDITHSTNNRSNDYDGGAEDDHGGGGDEDNHHNNHSNTK